MRKSIKIGVRAIVEHVFRWGDLSFDLFSQSRAVDGIRAHQYVQANRPVEYQPEVGVSFHHESPDCSLEIGGRIDGVMHQDNMVIVEEIKTSTRDKEHLAVNENPIHWGQLRAYAYIYAINHQLKEICGQLTYVNPENWQLTEFKYIFEIEVLDSFFSDLIRRYLKWADHQIAWDDIRTRSIQAMEFPYARYRPGQRQMAVSVYRTIRSRKKILVQAPTGIGKTMAAIFPAVKALEPGVKEKIFYLTARTTGRVAAENVFDILQRNGLRCKTVTLTAKDKICFCPGQNCHPEECRYAKGYYDRVNDAIWAALKFDRFDREHIEAVAQEFTICPFEFSLDISQWSDCIICDYNYVFDPRVFLRRYFSEGEGTNILLVDEAHNLVDRSREMFSAQIDKSALLELRRMLKGKLKGLYKCLTRINRWFSTVAGMAPEDVEQWDGDKVPSELSLLLTQFVLRAEKWLRLNIRNSYREALLEQYFAILGFLRVAEEFNDSYAVCYTKKNHDVSIKLFCIDPARQLAQALKRGSAAVFFSATLTPMDYFRSLFGCGPQVEGLALPSPFPRENFVLFRADHVSTYFRHREDTRTALCRLLSVFTEKKQGHYLFFFPSYAYLAMIHPLFVNARPNVDVIAQTPDMSEAARKEFLNRFKVDKNCTLVGFAVLGGIFGEGIDLVGDRLCGAAVIGVGLPGINLERELIRNYYEEKVQRGYEFAYRFPGINRVLQAAGRVIRTDTDRGAVLLVDPRFSQRQYTRLFPDHWHPVRIFNPERLSACLEDFWKGEL